MTISKGTTYIEIGLRREILSLQSEIEGLRREVERLNKIIGPRPQINTIRP